MLTYRDIKADEDRFLTTIWNAEENGPRWFRDASHAWTPDLNSFKSFFRRCDEIFGLFDDETLVAVIYLEFTSAFALNVHVSVIGKVPSTEVVRFFKSVKRQKARDGFTVMTGWILKNNRPLIRLGQEAGFEPTGLKMTYGASRGKALNWIQVRA